MTRAQIHFIRQYTPVLKGQGGEAYVARAYMDHVVDQAVTILKHRRVSGLFTTPKLLEALAEKIDLYEAGIRGVFCGGTTMAPQYVRFIVEEVLEGRSGARRRS